MLNVEQKEDMNRIADGVFGSFFGEVADSDTFKRMERELTIALWPLFGDSFLVSCYEAGLNNKIGAITCLLCLKEILPEGCSVLNTYQLNFVPNNKGE